MKLGERVTTAGLTIHEAPSEADAETLIMALIRELDMTAVPGRSLCRYPTEAGGGGVGFTLFVPITESFLVIDSWPDLGGAYLFICSCKPFLLTTVLRVLGDHKYRVGENHLREMRLVASAEREMAGVG